MYNRNFKMIHFAGAAAERARIKKQLVVLCKPVRTNIKE